MLEDLPVWFLDVLIVVCILGLAHKRRGYVSADKE
jgi:hypothetical protein